MKKTIKNITVATCCVATCVIHGAAMGTVACISKPSTIPTPAEYSIEWGNSQFGGIAACTDTNQGKAVDRLNIKLTNDELASCYCKLLRPAPSKWSLVDSFGYASCPYYCASRCASSTHKLNF